MENKYFTPSIGDIRIGYQCQIKYFSDSDFEEVIIDDEWTLCVLKEYINDSCLRVPYLTQAHLEERGWVLRTEYSGKYRLMFAKDNFLLSYNPENYMLFIIPLDPSKEFYEHQTRYAGTCKDPNTFDYICKLLNIE